MQRPGTGGEGGAAVERAGRGRSRRQWAWDSLAIAAGMATIGPLELYVAALGGTDAPSFAEWLLLPWVPFGVAVGALLLRGLDRWPGVVAGSLGYYVFAGAARPQIVFGIAADTLAALAICVLLRAWRFNPAIERWRDPLLLWAAAAVGALGDVCIHAVGLLGSAWFDPTHLYPTYAHVALGASGHVTLSLPLLQVAARWWLNWLAGVALVLPCLYALSAGRRHLEVRLPELPALLFVMLGWMFAMFAPLPWAGRLSLALVGLLLVAWSAIRFGAGLTAFMTLVMAFTTSVSYMFGRGPLHARPADALADAWAFIIMIAALGQVIIALLAERDAAARRQAASEERYRSLFESNPQPLWVQDPTSLRILMANEAAIRHYGYAREEFTALHATDLEAQPRPGAARDAGPASVAGVREHLHRTRDGALISVELQSHPIEFDGRDALLVFSYDVTDRNRLRSAFIGATDRAARQLGQELHDGLGQDLVGLSMIIRAQEAKAVRGVAPDAAFLGRIDGIAQRAVRACRNIAHGLSALVETQGDLGSALRRLPDRFASEGMPRLSVEIEDQAERAIADAARDHAYRICQEAITNAAKHARARRIDVRLAVTDARAVLTVRDDGVGLPADGARGAGLGLSSMQHRAAAIGAHLTVTSRRDGGTEVRVEFPEGPAACEGGRGSAEDRGAAAGTEVPISGLTPRSG